MKILVSSGHCYPAKMGAGASDRVCDCVVKGLAELGHRVFYQLTYGATETLPPGVELATYRRFDVDVMYLHDFISPAWPKTRGVPWTTTYHSHIQPDGVRRPPLSANTIFVSKAHATAFGRSRFVLNGIDPGEFTYSETKDDYFLFAVADLSDLQLKGFEIARSLVRDCGIRLIVCGSAPRGSSREAVVQKFAGDGIEYVGHVSGQRKADLFAGARCLLFPTQANETFGLVIAEALVSGTPVICSNRGACPELLASETAKVGFVCEHYSDYIEAIAAIDRISPAACRRHALERFHYLRMARDYVREFIAEIEGWPKRRDRWVEFTKSGRRYAVRLD